MSAIYNTCRHNRPVKIPTSPSLKTDGANSTSEPHINILMSKFPTDVNKTQSEMADVRGAVTW